MLGKAFLIPLNRILYFFFMNWEVKEEKKNLNIPFTL